MKTAAYILLLSAALTATGERYYNQEYAFSLDVPSGWLVSVGTTETLSSSSCTADAEDHIAVLSIAVYPDSRIELTPDGMYATFRRLCLSSGGKVNAHPSGA